MIVSQETLWIITAVITLLTCVPWAFYQMWRMSRLDSLDGNRHDIIFGGIIGIVMLFIGVGGVVKHYWL
jgi:hypothetical protein